jgi:hypothetical protein
MAYRVLGFVVWRGARWYLRRRAGRVTTAQKAGASGIVLAAVALGLLAGRRAMRSTAPGS